MPGHIPPQVKNRRSDKLHEVGEEAARKFFELNSGRVAEVLWEEFLEDEGLITGYTDNYIKVYAHCGDKNEANEFLHRITDVKLLELYADGMMCEV